MSANGFPTKAQPISIAKSSNPPNQTLYIRNLNDKIAKQDLRRALYTLFSTHGHVLDVVALKTNKMRGQAHVVFKDVQSSSQALQTLQGFDFLGKEMIISYGKGRSSIISKLDGTVKPPEASRPNPQSNAEAKKPNVITPTTTANKTLQPPTGTLKPATGTPSDGSKSPQGTKRPREDDSDEGEPMQEDDEDEEMEVSDED
ncbi:MAG: hypothetical protein Q9162_006010 [Coniocarpon cinnabarinum]